MISTMKNFMNTNEVFPILDMINRERQKSKGIHLSGIGGYADGVNEYVIDQWQVEAFEIVRDVGNHIDPMTIKQVVIVYVNGAIDVLTLKRGLIPPVSEDLPDSEYINYLMITEVEIETTYQNATSLAVAKIYRENGYGLLQRVELVYDAGYKQASVTE